jgi:hypothetical protein
LALEQFFDLHEDPQELHNLTSDASYTDIITMWRKRLLNKLKNRMEGFVHNRKLVKLNGPTQVCIDNQIFTAGFSDEKNSVSFY